MLTWVLSHRFDISSPSIFSWSPYKKNSVWIFSVHIQNVFAGLVGFPKSAAWTRAFIISPLCFPLRSKSSAYDNVWSSFINVKCLLISVNRILSIICFLIAVCSKLLKLLKMFELSSLSKVNKTAEWWFSRTDWSLYLIERSDLVFIWKKLLLPGWSTSWAAPETKSVKTSRAEASHTCVTLPLNE